jgi:hypothetical protein
MAAASGHRGRVILSFDLVDGDMISSWPGAGLSKHLGKLSIAGYPR